MSLAHGASISGTVTYADGTPAVGIPVHLLRQTASGEFEEPALQTLGSVWDSDPVSGTDADGHYHLPGLPPGRYALRAALPLGLLKNAGNEIKDMLYLGPESAALAMKIERELSIYSGNAFSPQNLTPISITANQAYNGANITIPLRGLQTVKVHGQDSASGEPVQVAQVELRDATGKDVLRAGFVDDGGDCAFDDVPEGSYSVALVDGVDVSSSAPLSLRNLATGSKAVHYAPASTSVQVNGGPSQAVLRVSKLPAPPAGNSTHPQFRLFGSAIRSGAPRRG